VPRRAAKPPAAACFLPDEMFERFVLDGLRALRAGGASKSAENPSLANRKPRSKVREFLQGSSGSNCRETLYDPCEYRLL
jgi:hypothetical protein